MPDVDHGTAAGPRAPWAALPEQPDGCRVGADRGDLAPGRGGGGYEPQHPRRAGCGARTRGGSPCRSPAVRGKRRCRMHGAWAGPPRGNRNALRHGQRTAEALAWRWRVRELLAEARELVEEVG